MGSGGTGGGITDHGALTGLGDDDHLQYHTDARGDARYVKLTGAQTIADSKTFSGTIKANGWTVLNSAFTSDNAYIDARKPIRYSSVTISDDADLVTKAYVDTAVATNTGDTSDCVKLTGNQSIAGAKTFTDNPIVDNGSGTSWFTLNSTTGNTHVQFKKNDVRRGLIHNNGDQTVITQYNSDASASTAVLVLDDGFISATVDVRAPTGSETTSLTNKGYVDGLDGANVKLTGAQTIAGTKTFTSDVVIDSASPLIQLERSGTRSLRFDADDTFAAMYRYNASAALTAHFKLYDTYSTLNVPLRYTNVSISNDDDLVNKEYVDTAIAGVAASSSGSTFNGGTVTTNIEINSDKSQLLLNSTNLPPRLHFEDNTTRRFSVYANDDATLIRSHQRVSGGDNELIMYDGYTESNVDLVAPNIGSMAARNHWTGTETEYLALGSYDANTTYDIYSGA